MTDPNSRRITPAQAAAKAATGTIQAPADAPLSPAPDDAQPVTTQVTGDKPAAKAASTMTVTNKGKVLQVVNLERGVDYGHDDLAATTTTFEEPAEGGGVRHLERVLPASITWLPGEKKTGLPLRVREAPEFRALEQAGKLRVETT